MNFPKKITNKAAYNKVMAELEKLSLKGSETLSEQEFQAIRELSIIAQQYEQATYEIEAPATLAGMIEWKMFQLKLRQKELARKLNVSEAKLSLIMNGKQKPDVAFLKSAYKNLNIDADFLLEHA